MGFFDRFRKRVKEVAEETDLDSLTADEDSEEAKAALLQREEVIAAQIQSDEKPNDDDWDDIEEIDSVIISDDDDWDDLDDDPIPTPISSQLDKKERKRIQQKEKIARKEKKKLKKLGFDLNQETKPEGSRVDLHVMRSTTGRKLVEVKSAPRGSTGAKVVETESGKQIKIDLGVGVVESGGKVIKSGSGLDKLLEELEWVLLESAISSPATTR